MWCCDVVSEIDLTQLPLREETTAPAICSTQNQIDGHWIPSTIATWQPGLEECARAAIGTEEQPHLDAAVRDREGAESILDGVQFFSDVLFDEFIEFIVTHQLHSTTILEVARVIRKNTARLLLFHAGIPCKLLWSFDARMISS